PHVPERATPLRGWNFSRSSGKGVFQQNRPQAVVVPRPPKRTLTDNGRLLGHITNAALRHDTRIRHPLCSATEPHGTVQASIPMAVADAVPSEEFALVPGAVVFRTRHARFLAIKAGRQTH